MDYRRFGRTGLRVSPVCLGCMSFGVPDRGNHPWTLDEAASRPIIRQAVEAGINFFDTANSYSDGTSEEIVGRALADYAQREEIVVATKVFFPPRNAPNLGGLSRKAIFQSVDGSLKRLGMDYIDLLQIHRWDYDTDIAETMEALHDVVKAGKARYIGASSMFAWQFAKSLYTSRAHGWTEFVSMQNHLNLLYREEEREMMPLCRDQGIAVMPWSPLARGRLTRDWEQGSERESSDKFGSTLYARNEDADKAIVKAVADVASARGVSRAQVAMAWLMQQEGVTSPIVGASKSQHLADAIAATDLVLSADELKTLQSPYVPQVTSGFS